jgi:hypothetical protein
MRLETGILLEDTVRKEAQTRFPSLDADWAVKRYMDKMYNNSKKTAEVLVAWARADSVREAA